jgi:hypothetical protein
MTHGSKRRFQGGQAGEETVARPGIGEKQGLLNVNQASIGVLDAGSWSKSRPCGDVAHRQPSHGDVIGFG